MFILIWIERAYFWLIGARWALL